MITVSPKQERKLTMTNSSFQPPTPEQTAWVFKQLLQHMNEGGTFRTLIYNKLGYSPKEYKTLYEDGFGLSQISDELNQYQETLKWLMDKQKEGKGISVQELDTFLQKIVEEYL